MTRITLNTLTLNITVKGQALVQDMLDFRQKPNMTLRPEQRSTLKNTSALRVKTDSTTQTTQERVKVF